MSTHDAHDPHPKFCRTCGGPLVLGEPEFDHGYDPQTGAPETVRRLRCVNPNLIHTVRALLASAAKGAPA